MFEPRDIIETLAANVRQTRSPFGIPRVLVNQWHRKLNLKATGDYMLFTGMMYQFTPFIDQSTRTLSALEGTKWETYLKYARYMPGYLSGLGLAVMTGAGEKRAAGKFLKNMVRLLEKSKVDFGYDPAADHYSGILLYDMGEQAGFVRHARYVAGQLRRRKIRKLITVDPHTTYALKVLYPKYADAHFQVTPWFELLDLPAGQSDAVVTLHDPCFYGRYLKVSEGPRRVLAGLGIGSDEVRNSKEFTACCGGPAESISPALSREIMEKRVCELGETGRPIVALCPICLGHLKKSGADVEDFSELVMRHAS